MFNTTFIKIDILIKVMEDTLSLSEDSITCQVTGKVVNYLTFKILAGSGTNVATVPVSGGVANSGGGEAACAGAACSRCACCGCTLREAAARHEQRVAANERLERANLEWKQVH